MKPRWNYFSALRFILKSVGPFVSKTNLQNQTYLSRHSRGQLEAKVTAAFLGDIMEASTRFSGWQQHRRKHDYPERALPEFAKDRRGTPSDVPGEKRYTLQHAYLQWFQAFVTSPIHYHSVCHHNLLCRHGYSHSRKTGAGETFLCGQKRKRRKKTRRLHYAISLHRLATEKHVVAPASQK